MKNENHRNYRFWALFAASFIRTFYNSIYGLALPNYYIYTKSVSSSLVGTISSIAAITYIFGPLLGRFITKKTRMKTTLWISTSFSLLMMILVVSATNPAFTIIFRSLEGLSNGLFWPELFNYITSWEKYQGQNENKTDFLKVFNYAWNFGLILGFGVGYVLVFLIGSDFIALIVSLCIAGIGIVNLFFFESSEKFHMHENKAVVIQDYRYFPQNREELENPPKAPYTTDYFDKSLVNVPLIMGLGGILLFASTKSILRFTLPYFLENLGFSSQWVYLIVLGQQALQISGLQIIRKFKKMRYGYWVGVIMLFGSIIAILLYPSNIYIIVIINVETGLFFGLIHGTAQRIILDKGKYHESKKYTMLSEACIGIAFGIPPIVAGFLLELKFLYVFLFQIGVLIILIVILLVNHFKYMKSEKLGIFKVSE